MLTAKRWFSPDCTPEAEDRSGNRIVVAPFARCAERGPVIKVSLASVRQTDARWGGTGNHIPEGAWTAESCIRKAVAGRGLTPGLVGLADAKAEDEAASRWADCRFAYGD
jgi:hypothetical protein